MISINRKHNLTLFFLFIHLICMGQVRLDNASFEGEPQDATTPIGWMECERHTTPDILPGPWGVYLEPSDGNTYIGLITRQNGTWEAIGQRLSNNLKKGECYLIRMDLAFSKTYAGYNDPVKMRMWAGRDRCSKDYLVAETKLIEHQYWKTYTFEFRPERNVKYIILEAYYNENKKYTHNGNILIDNISSIRLCPRA